MELRILCHFLCFHFVLGQVLSEEICKRLMNSKCVNINLCKPVANVLMLFDITMETRENLMKISCGFDGTIPKVCCPNVHLIPKEASQRSFQDLSESLNSINREPKELAVPFDLDRKQDEYKPQYGSALDTILDRVVETTTLLGPVKKTQNDEPTATSFNIDSIQEEKKHVTPTFTNWVQQIEPGYGGLALDTIWNKGVESTTLLEPIKKKQNNETTASSLNSGSIQEEIKHSTTTLIPSKVGQIEPGYGGLAFETIWDRVVEPTTLSGLIKKKQNDEPTVTSLNNNSTEGEMEFVATPLSSSKVYRIEPGYRGLAFDTIWGKVVEPAMFSEQNNEPKASSFNINSTQWEMVFDASTLNSWRVPTPSTVVPDKILDVTKKPFNLTFKSDEDLGKPIKKSTDFIAAFPSPPECGLSKSSFGGRVVDGVDANLGDLPWMALLGYRDRVSVTSWNCGGSLISHRHVLTAAHCIHNYEKSLYVVRLGELDLAREDEGAIPIDVLIKNTIKHEQYDPKSYENDIGVLVLQNDVHFTELIMPICLPLNSKLRSADFVDWRPFIAGWGKLNARGPTATRLQVLQLPIVSNEVCSATYKPYENKVIDHRVVCAGFMEGGKDSCGGDSGGPLMQPFPQNFTSYFYEIGVISFGARDCAIPGYPGVYTWISSFMTWLETHVLGAS